MAGAAILPYSFPAMETRAAIGIIGGIVAGLTLAALVADVACLGCLKRHEHNAAAWYLSAGIWFAMCAGICGAALIPTSHPAIIAVFCMACTGGIEAAIMSTRVAHPQLIGMVRVCMIVFLLAALSCATAICLDVRPSILAAFGIAMGMWGTQMMANLVVRVPDRYLVQWRTYMTRRWTVRGSIPEDARMLTDDDVHEDMQRFLAQYTAGTICCTACIIMSFIALAGCADYSAALERVTFLTVGIAIVLYLALKPRQSGRPFERFLLRGAAVASLCVLVSHMPQALPHMGAHMALAVIGVCAVVGLALGFGMISQNNGFYSLALSRLGDGCCFAALCLAPVAAFLSAGLVEWLRGVV
ncbi:hypothetical protein [Bifidobacterium criceti]|nr:hypothetical protein [Bifidobacterium criceti]